MDRKTEILIAEDSRTQAEQLRYILEENGYSVTVTSNGRQALAAARAHKPELVISDIVMPEMDGYTLCKEIKSDAMLKDIPVILVTTLSDPHDIIKGLKCGADNFIKKPYNEKYLLSRIAYLQMNRQMRRNEGLHWGLEVYLAGEQHLITAERQQILDLLMSTYEQAIEVNDELKAKHKELIRSNQNLDALCRIAECLNHAVSEQQAVDEALARVMELPGVGGGWILLKTGQAQFRMAAACRLPAALVTPEALNHHCQCRRQLLSGEFDFAVNICECECLQGAKGGLCHHASVPLHNDGHAIGVMNLLGTELGLFSDEALKILHTVGSHVGVALGRAWLYEHLEAKVAERTAALTHEIAERERIAQEMRKLSSAVAKVADAIFITDYEGVIDYVNPAFEQITGYSREEALGQKANILKSGIQDKDFYANLWKTILSGHVFREVLINRRKTGELYYEDKTITPLQDGNGTIRHFISTGKDITERIQAQERLYHLAHYDALTQLPNRNLLLDRLNHAIIQARRSGHPVAVLFVDLDRFKIVNDSLGHAAGDALLQAVAARLKASIRESDTVARHGGDEFVIVLLEDQPQENLAVLVARRIVEAMQLPFRIEDQEFFVAASIGISFFSKDGGDAEILLKNADTAMYRAKERGGNSIEFYAEEMNARALERFLMENNLRYALERGELELYYQPQVELQEGRITGVEALLRWRHPQQGMIPPAEFIPLAEETGLIIPIGEWVLRTACTQAKAWQDAGLAALHVSVNLSIRQFTQPGLTDLIARVLEETGLQACYLELEITESLLMRDVEGAVVILRALKDMGVSLSIDDFGTGYSMLSYLKCLPIDRLKIDQSFVRDITTDPDNAAIALAIITMAHGMRLKVIAEGMETEAQLAFLSSKRCDQIQGFYFSRPLPAEEMAELLRENRTLRLVR